MSIIKSRLFFSERDFKTISLCVRGPPDILLYHKLKHFTFFIALHHLCEHFFMNFILLSIQCMQLNILDIFYVVFGNR